MRASFYILIISFLAGVLGRSFFAFDVIDLVALAGIALAVACIALFMRIAGASLTVLIVCASALGVVRTEFANRAFEAGRVYDDGARVTEVGTVIAEPDVREEHTVLVVVLDTGTDTRVRLVAPHHPAYVYGDVVRLEGELHIPRSFTGDTGRTFNYPGFLKKDGIHYEMRQPVIQATGETGGNPIVSALFASKQRWLEAVSRVVPEPSASLLGGVVVGAKQSLGEAWLSLFRETGIIHIVVLSGYNLTIIAAFIVWLTGRFPPRVRLALGISAIIAFALMTGGGATVLRASLMAILALVAHHIHRPYVIARALALAAFLMVAHNPFVLAFDPGFQLSFMATLGLVYGSPLCERMFSRVPAYLGIRTILAATCATQLAVLPLLMYSMGTVSLVAPLTNILVLPIVPVVMAYGFGAGMLALFHTWLAIPFALLAHLLLSYIFFVVKLTASVPHASLMLPILPWWSVPFLYTVLLLGYRIAVSKTARSESSGSA